MNEPNSTPGQRLVPLPHSERAPIQAAEPAGSLDLSQRAEVTLILRRAAPLPGGQLTAAELRDGHAAAGDDIDAVRQAMTSAGLEVTGEHPASRRVTVAGTLADLSRVFGTTLAAVTSPAVPGLAGDRVTHRYREGELSVPAALDGVVTAVLGLDDRPAARPHVRPRTAAHRPQADYTAAQVAALYRFPAATAGAATVIAVIELGGGYAQSDLDAAGLTARLTAVSVDGGQNSPGSDPQGADVEVALDVQLIAGAAPGAEQVVYFAPNTDRGFVDAISDATHATPAPAAISVSWGQSEDAWTGQARTAMDAAIADASALGITVCVASGDNGSGDGDGDGRPHADFPASSPHALGCGGTRLSSSGAGISGEVTWDDPGGGAGGGGVSDKFPLPAWQAAAGVPRRHGGTGTGRGVPDVAGNASPATGYRIISGGQPMVVGGTSAVAPLWAALIGLLSGPGPVGIIQPKLYAAARAGHAAPGFRDITSGSNGAYSAEPGWDPCTGLGSPDGAALARLLHPAS